MNRQKLNRINRLAEQIGNGTREQTNKAFEEMMGIYKNEFRIIINHWSKQHNYSLDTDDLIQIASITLFETAVRWNDSKRGRDFACYVNTAIRMALVKATAEDSPIKVPYGTQQRRQNRKKAPQQKINVASTDKMHATFPNFEEGETMDTETLYLKKEQMKEQMKKLYTALRLLPEDERELIIRHYGLFDKKESFADIAKTKGVTKQAICYNVKQILQELQTILMAMGMEQGEIV